MEEKKEIGTLIELYRDYLTDEIKKEMYVNGADEEYISMARADEVEEEDLDEFLNQLSVLKKFVKRLVENDKIDMSHLEFQYQDIMYELLEGQKMIKEKSDFLIMLLSVSDTPIDLLLSILK